MLFLAKSPFCQLLEIKLGKNTTKVFHKRKGPGALDHERGAMRTERGLREMPYIP
jgi:hypothetical protein